MIHVVQVLGILSFVDALFDKLNVWFIIREKLYMISEKKNMKVFHDLAECMFCQRFWLLATIFGTYISVIGFELDLLIIPFCVMGLFQLLKRD